MGSFFTRCKIENSVDRHRSAFIQKLLVDSGSEYTWLPTPTLEKIGIEREKKDLTFVMANGQQITRSVGFGIIRVGASFTIDEVVFGEKGDLLLLGARTLEGLNLTIDPVRKKLVAAGPLPAALSQLLVSTACDSGRVLLPSRSTYL
ncbi:MAG: retroviral-like aspartic protease family protein [bacterium]